MVSVRSPGLYIMPESEHGSLIDAAPLLRSEAGAVVAAAAVVAVVTA